MECLNCELLYKELIITGLKIKLQCWVIPVNERSKLLIPKYYILGSVLIAFMYDITNFNTLISLNEYLHTIREKYPQTPKR